MAWFKDFTRTLGYIINPLGIVADYINGKNNNPNEPANEQNNYENNLAQKVDDAVSKVYDDLTGKSNIELQNEFNRQMAEEEYQRNIESIGDTAAAYEAAGFNRNMVYGSGNGSPVSYQAPDLQAYSGSKKLDAILQRTGKVLSIIPSMYQATAALEAIDQAREKTKQSEIKTMADGLNLLNLGYNVGEKRFALPFSPTLYPYRFGDKRHVKQVDYSSLGLMSNGDLSRYMDAAFKNKIDLLESIGISNSLRNTRNNYLGYQYELDRRFGAAGRVVGMASQGLRGVSSLFSPIKLFK